MPRWRGAHSNALFVALAAGAAGPIGGDRLRLDIEVGAGACLVLRAVSASVVLPGPRREPSFLDVAITVAEDATLIWLPGTVIAANGCDHHASTHISLDQRARLYAREELLLGRHGEQTGAISQRLRIEVGAHALYDQQLRVGAGAPGWDGPAVSGACRAIGSIVIADPGAGVRQEFAHMVGTPEPRAACLVLSDSAVALTALASDSLDLSRRFEAAGSDP
jgi:urease accessory protein